MYNKTEVLDKTITKTHAPKSFMYKNIATVYSTDDAEYNRYFLKNNGILLMHSIIMMHEQAIMQ